MYMADLLATGKQLGTIQPSIGLFNNMLEYDKYRGMAAAAMAPIGTLDVAGKESNFVRALGVSPVYYELTGDKNAGPCWPINVYVKLREHLKVVKYEEVDHTQFTVRPTTEDREWSMFHDSNCMYIMTPTITYNRLMMEIQEEITNAYPSGGVKPVVVGLAYVKDDKFIALPKKSVKYGSHSMTIDVPQSDLKVAQAREIALYTGLVAIAIRKLVEEVDSLTSDEVPNSPHPKEEEDIRGYYNSWATYVLMAYAGANKLPPEGQLYTATDLYDYTLSYLGLPFSNAYPYLTYPKDDAQAARLQTTLLALNISLAIAGARIGGKTLPVQYLKERGSIHTAEEVLKYYLRMPMDVGGSNAIWMHPAYNVPVKNTILVPYPMQPGENEWEINTQFPTTYKDVVVDRGEIPMTESEGPGVDTMRLITTRDSRVIVVRKFDNEFILMKIPVMEKKRIISNGLSFLLSYVADATLAPKGGIPVDRRYTQGGSVIGMISNVRGIYEFEMEGRDARGNLVKKETATSLPGGIQEGEINTPKAVQGKDVPKGKTEAELKAEPAEPAEDGVFKGAKDNIIPAKTGEE